MDLIRDLLLRLESLPLARHDVWVINADDEQLRFDEYTVGQVDYHLSLLHEAGLINDGGAGSLTGYGFPRLSWEGHDLIDSVRDPELWKKTKSGAMTAGGFTMKLIADLAKGFLKKQIEERTGVTL